MSPREGGERGTLLVLHPLSLAHLCPKPPRVVDWMREFKRRTDRSPRIPRGPTGLWAQTHNGVAKNQTGSPKHGLSMR